MEIPQHMLLFNFKNGAVVGKAVVQQTLSFPSQFHQDSQIRRLFKIHNN